MCVLKAGADRLTANRLAKAVLVILGLGLVATMTWVWLRPRNGNSVSKPVMTADPAAKVPGGKDLLLDIFDQDGRLLWRLRLATAIMTKDMALESQGVSADYSGAELPAKLVADRLRYNSSQALLAFSGGVRLTGPALTLICADLTWDDKAGAFTIRGRYTLTRQDTVMSGEGLWASRDLKTIRALGGVKLSTTAFGENQR